MSTATKAGNKQLFDELSKEYPNCGLIRSLLNDGQADINALTVMRNDHLTAYWYMRSGMSKYNHHWNICHPFWGSTVIIEEKLRIFKAHFYPLLDILEDYNFNIMNGAIFRLHADGSKYLHTFAGFRSLDLAEFDIMAKHDVPRLIQFFERLYFSQGYAVDDSTTTGIPYLSPLLWNSGDFYNPEVILYFIMKGARWNQPAWRQSGYEERITNFAALVSPAKAADMITMLQKVLGVNYATGCQGTNLRGFLAAAYGTVTAVHILEKVVGAVAKVRRVHVLASVLWIAV